jgi:hypothetical protein
MAGVVSKKGIKRLLALQGIKAGPDALKNLAATEEKTIGEHIEGLARKAKISGRKVLKKSDI